MLYTVASKTLHLYARYVENFQRIVPVIQRETTTKLSRQQLNDLYNAGCSLSFLLSECDDNLSEEFNASPRGRILQCQLNNDREATHALRLETILSQLSIPICDTISSA